MILPVTHMHEGTELWFNDEGSWFYYARGCSDFGFDVGRTMLVSNRYEAAVQLVQRKSKLEKGQRELTRLQAVRHVANRLLDREPQFVNETLHRARESSHSFMLYLGPRPSNISLENLLADAARGIMDPVRCRVRGGGISAPCRNACAARTKALTYTLMNRMFVIDHLNAALLRELCGTEQQLDSIQLLHQPSARHQRGLAYASTEIWDTRIICHPRKRKSNVAMLQPWHSWANGSQCSPSPWNEFSKCFACNGSLMQQLCQRHVADLRERSRRVAGGEIRVAIT